MQIPTRLLALVSAAALTACSTPKDEETEITGPPTLTDAVPVPTATGESERFIIRDKQQRIRVDGRVRGGYMDGMWVYYDSRGEKLAIVNYRLNQRQGPAQLYFVTADGPAVGRLRMAGTYTAGTLDGMVQSNWAAGSKKLERDFDHGILQGARGWTAKGARMSDGEAMTAAIEESRSEEALLSELENFVMLQLRKKSSDKAEDVVPDTELEPAPLPPPAAVPYSGGTAPLTSY